MDARVFIQDVYNITGIGPIPVGQVKEGVLRIGMSLNINGKVMTVNGMEMHHKKIQEAQTGDNIGITLKNADYNLLKSIIRTEVTFSGDGTVQTIRQQPTQPEGTFSFLRKIFRKNKE